MGLAGGTGIRLGGKTEINANIGHLYRDYSQTTVTQESIALTSATNPNEFLAIPVGVFADEHTLNINPRLYNSFTMTLRTPEGDKIPFTFDPEDVGTFNIGEHDILGGRRGITYAINQDRILELLKEDPEYGDRGLGEKTETQTTKKGDVTITGQIEQPVIALIDRFSGDKAYAELTAKGDIRVLPNTKEVAGRAGINLDVNFANIFVRRPNVDVILGGGVQYGNTLPDQLPRLQSVFNAQVGNERFNVQADYTNKAGSLKPGMIGAELAYNVNNNLSLKAGANYWFDAQNLGSTTSVAREDLDPYIFKLRNDLDPNAIGIIKEYGGQLTPGDQWWGGSIQTAEIGRELLSTSTTNHFRDNAWEISLGATYTFGGDQSPKLGNNKAPKCPTFD